VESLGSKRREVVDLVTRVFSFSCLVSSLALDTDETHRVRLHEDRFKTYQGFGFWKKEQITTKNRLPL